MRAIPVSAPARLHLGFLDLNGSLGRNYGSIGLAVDARLPSLSFATAGAFQAIGPEKSRAETAVRRLAALYAAGRAYAVDVRQAIPAHAGLGSGTQLALAIGTAVLKLSGSRASRQFARRSRRTRRAARRSASRPSNAAASSSTAAAAPPTIRRRPSCALDFPDDWRAILVLDPRDVRRSWRKRKAAFQALPEFPEASRRPSLPAHPDAARARDRRNRTSPPSARR